MLRVRFHANYNDSRPINWPVSHPFWESGFTGDESYAIVISYANDLDYITTNWPEASEIEILEENATYKFTNTVRRNHRQLAIKGLR